MSDRNWLGIKKAKRDKLKKDYNFHSRRLQLLKLKSFHSYLKLNLLAFLFHYLLKMFLKTIFCVYFLYYDDITSCNRIILALFQNLKEFQD